MIREAIMWGLLKILRGAKGQVVTFTPKRVAKMGGLSTKPVTLSIVRYYLEEELGLRVWKRGRHGIRYIMTRNDHPELWEKAKNGY
ncbi:hypothetical protein DRN38_00150 [Thermococci archaeon]|nr:MAG: hypothetical protein DRN38_00150 [Thermococci archaeon]